MDDEAASQRVMHVRDQRWALLRMDGLDGNSLRLGWAGLDLDWLGRHLLLDIHPVDNMILTAGCPPDGDDECPIWPKGDLGITDIPG